MATTTRNAADESSAKPTSGRTLVLFLIPLLLLAGVIALFWFTDGAGLQVEPAAPIETVEFQRTVLTPGEIELHLRNTSPEAITLSAVNINDALWPFTVTPDRTISRLGEATVTLNYPWVEAEAYAISLFSTNAVAFDTEVGVATETATASKQTLLSFTLVGIYVGIIPVILGMLWLPAIRNLSTRAMLFLMAVTVGLLLYLGVDATSEAIEQAGALAGPFQGIGIVAIGIVGTVLLLDAIGRRQQGVGRTEAGQRMTLAALIAVGIGLHNLGEGLAIGAAYAIGEAALGAFLVIGFIIQNITEGLGIVVPIARDKPSLRILALFGLIGGAPAIVGAWIGGLVVSQPLSVLFLAIGAGAVFQVAYQIGRELVWRKDAKRPMPLTAFAGVTAGMLVLYVTGVIIN
ncbi:MAG: metal transporter [Chloroflexia bacterium]|nr:metal transporter [Chloroflexia bacterium]